MRTRYGVLSLLVAVFASVAYTTAYVAPAKAQGVAGVTADTWSGKNDLLSTVSTSISTTTAVITAVSGKVINVRSITFRVSAGGVVQFQDGSGGTTIGSFYAVTNTPYTLYEGQFGGGMRTSSGTGLYAVLSGATLTALVRYQTE